MNKADPRRALGFWDQALALQQPLIDQGRHELANDLAGSYLGKATALSVLQDDKTAESFYDQAIALRERLVKQEGRRDLTSDLAFAFMGKGIVASNQRDMGRSLQAYDQSVGLFERLVNQEGRSEFRGDLLKIQALRLVPLAELQDLKRATADALSLPLLQAELAQTGRYDLQVALNVAMAALKRMHDRPPVRPEQRSPAEIAQAYLTEGEALSRAGKKREARDIFDRAIQSLEHLVRQERRVELTHLLGKAYYNKAMVCGAEPTDRLLAANLYQQAVDIFEPLVRNEGRRELKEYLAGAYYFQAGRRQALGDAEFAVILDLKAQGLYEDLVHRDGRMDLGGNLASIWSDKAILVANQPDPDIAGQAGAFFDRAIALLQRLVDEMGRSDLRQDLANIQAARASWAARMAKR